MINEHINYETVNLNDHTLLAKIHKDQFINSPVFIEHVASDLGIDSIAYNYRINQEGNFINIFFQIDNGDNGGV